MSDDRTVILFETYDQAQTAGRQQYYTSAQGFDIFNMYQSCLEEE